MFMTANPQDPLFITAVGDQDPLFMTARQDQDIFKVAEEPEDHQVFMTARPIPISIQANIELEKEHTVNQVHVSPGDGSAIGDGDCDGGNIPSKQVTPNRNGDHPAKDHTSPISPEGSLQMTLTSSISPSASIEMGLTLNRHLQHLIDSANCTSTSEHSVLASWSNSIVKDNPFLPEVCVKC